MAYNQNFIFSSHKTNPKNREWFTLSQLFTLPQFTHNKTHIHALENELLSSHHIPTKEIKDSATSIYSKSKHIYCNLNYVFALPWLKKIKFPHFSLTTRNSNTPFGLSHKLTRIRKNRGRNKRGKSPKFETELAR